MKVENMVSVEVKLYFMCHIRRFIYHLTLFHMSSKQKSNKYMANANDFSRAHSLVRSLAFMPNSFMCTPHKVKKI